MLRHGIIVCWLLVKCGTAVCGMQKEKCKMETVERCCGMAGKMRNVEICRMWAIVCPQQEGIVNYHTQCQHLLG